MERNKLAPPNVVSISRQGLLVCGATLSGVLRMPFPPNVLKDLNVADFAALAAEVKSFVEASRIKPSPLVVILNQDVYFEKLLGENMNLEMSQQVQDFIDSVPLTNPSSKVFKIGNKYHAVVINRRLYESVRSAFEALGFGVVAVVPELVLGQVGVGTNFDAAACRLVLRKMDFIKENSYMSPVHDPSQDNLVNKNKGIALGLSLGSILIALAAIGVISWQITQTKQVAIARIKAQAAEKAIVPIPSPTIVQISYKVLLQNVPATVSAQLKQIASLTISESASAAGSTASVAFLTTVPSSIREQIVNVLRAFRTGIVVTEAATSQFDVRVSLPQITP